MSKTKYIELSQLISKSKKDIELTPEELTALEAMRDFVVSTARGERRKRIGVNMQAHNLVYIANKSLLSRVMYVANENGRSYASYCAGQDYQSEMQEVRKILDS